MSIPYRPIIVWLAFIYKLPHFFIRQIQGLLNGSYMPQWSSEFKEALTLETRFICIDDYIHQAWELMAKIHEILQTLNEEFQIQEDLYFWCFDYVHLIVTVWVQKSWFRSFFFVTTRSLNNYYFGIIYIASNMLNALHINRHERVGNHGGITCPNVSITIPSHAWIWSIISLFRDIFSLSSKAKTIEELGIVNYTTWIYIAYQNVPLVSCQIILCWKWWFWWLLLCSV